jgi:hypothetical protein
MAFANLIHMRKSRIAGLFKSGNQWFEYKMREAEDFPPEFAPHLNIVLFVGPEGNDLRLGGLLSTRIHVAVDELPNGQAKIESWPIRHHRPYG